MLFRSLYSRTSGAPVVGVSDAFADKAGQVAATVPGCRVIGDPLAAIADDDVDAVLIATPGQFHEEQVLACIEHGKDRKSTRLNSSHANISYAVFCLKKKTKNISHTIQHTS